MKQSKDSKQFSRVPYVVLRKEIVKTDPWLQAPENNGRKVLVNSLLPEAEVPLMDAEWAPGEESVPVLETGYGGLEVATFTQGARQDCHRHEIGTEIYLVLEGEMTVRLEEKSEVVLEAGDELIVLPGTSHEVMRDGKPFLARLHSIDCHGKQDKYVKAGGEGWVLKGPQSGGESDSGVAGPGLESEG